MVTKAFQYSIMMKEVFKSQKKVIILYFVGVMVSVMHLIKLRDNIRRLFLPFYNLHFTIFTSYFSRVKNTLFTICKLIAKFFFIN